MEEQKTEASKLDEKSVLAICAATEISKEAGPDAKIAAKVVLALHKRKLLEGVEAETQMAMAEEIAEIVSGVFGGVVGAVVRISKAKTFADQQREIVYLTSRLAPKGE